jgi:hypothetical protein
MVARTGLDEKEAWKNMESVEACSCRSQQYHGINKKGKSCCEGDIKRKRGVAVDEICMCRKGWQQQAR